MSMFSRKFVNGSTRMKMFVSIIAQAARKNMFLLLGLSIVIGLMSPVALWVSMYLIDELVMVLLAKCISYRLLIWLLILFALDFIQVVLSNIIDIIQIRLTDEVSIYISDQVLDKAIKLPMVKFDDAEIYNKIRLTIQETPDRCLLIISCTEGIIKSLIQLAGVLVILVKLQWVIGIIPVLLLVPLFILRFKISKDWFQAQGKRIEQMRYTDEIKNLLLKNENIKELRLFGISNFLKEKALYLQKKFNKENLETNKKYSGLNVLASVVNGLYSFGIKLWIIILGIEKSHAIGSVTMYINAIDTYGNAIENILQQMSLMTEQFLYIGYICEIASMCNAEEERLIKLMENIHRIEFDDVSFSYRSSDKPVLDHVSMIMESGHLYALVGMNGSGKTTLLKLLTKIYLPSSGKIYINGVDISLINGDSLRRRMTAIFQDFIRYPFSVSSNISLSENEPMAHTVRSISKEVGLDKDIIQLSKGYETQLKCEWNEGTDLSGGQWQKVALARCFYKMADVYIYDEPFSWIDQISKKQIMDYIVRKTNKRICMLVSHQYDIMPQVDEIFVMDNGQIVERGTHDELMKHRAFYYQMAENEWDKKSST